MEEIKKMLRAVINGQSALKQELLGKVDGVNNKVDKLSSEMHDEFSRTNKRIDKLGKQLTYLEDDTPTVEDFEKLEERVEGKIASL